MDHPTIVRRTKFNNKIDNGENSGRKVTNRSQYDEAAAACKDIFILKTNDYGTSWRVLRTISIADQLYIKARRIRTLQETEDAKVKEDKAGEFRAMVNYGIIGLIQLSLGADTPDDLSVGMPPAGYTMKSWRSHGRRWWIRTMIMVRPGGK